MLIGVGNKILTNINNRISFDSSDINLGTNLGTNIWILDTRRWYQVYRTSNPANNIGINNLVPSLFPIDVSAVSTFTQPINTFYPIFFRNTFGCDCLYVYRTSGLFSGYIASTTLNTSNAATSLTAAYRVRLVSVNTINNVGILMQISNNSDTASRFAIGFDNLTSNSALFVAVGNTDVAGDFFYGTYNLQNLRLSNFYDKWVTFIVDMNYVSNLLRIWVNGRLVLTRATGITAGALPNTNATFSSVINKSDFSFTGYCSYARLFKNGNPTNNDVIRLHNLMENSTLQN
jgi:hypothetical protein